MTWREWEGEIALFHGSDEAVHFLDATHAAVFSALLNAEQPVSVTDLVDVMLTYCVAETAVAEVDSVLREILPQFRRLGIAEQLPCPQ